MKALAQALATIGYTAFALDMYGEEGFPFKEALPRRAHVESRSRWISTRCDQISARVLMMLGDQDPVIPPQDRLSFAKEMTAKHAK